MKNNATYLFVFLACALFSSCYTPRYVYSPAAHNVPVLVKKGDSKLAINYSVNFADNTVKENVAVKGKARGFDLQGAYAFSKHWAAQFSYMQRKERNAGDFDNNLLDSTVINYKRRLTEMGLGYFHKLDDNSHVLFQFFAGAGLGAFSFTDEGRDHTGLYRNRFHQMRITKFFIQPAVLVRSKDNFAASLSSRHSVIYFRKIHTDYTAAELDNYTLDSLNNRPRVFWEPALVNNFGFKKLPGIRLELQLGFSFLMSGRFVDYRSSNVSAGLLVDLPKLFANSRRSSNTKLKD